MGNENGNVAPFFLAQFMFEMRFSAGHYGRVFHDQQARGHQSALASQPDAAALAEWQESEHEARLAFVHGPYRPPAL